MYLHIVMMAFKSAPGATLLHTLQQNFAKVQQDCPGIAAFRLVENQSKTSAQYTHALYSVFSDLPALDAYRHSPAHDAMMVDLKPFVDHIVVLDSPLDVGLLV